MIVHNDSCLCYQVQIPRHPLHPLSTSSLQRHLPNDDGQPPLTIDSLLVQATENLPSTTDSCHSRSLWPVGPMCVGKRRKDRTVLVINKKWCLCPSLLGVYLTVTTVKKTPLKRIELCDKRKPKICGLSQNSLNVLLSKGICT